MFSTILASYVILSLVQACMAYVQMYRPIYAMAREQEIQVFEVQHPAVTFCMIILVYSVLFPISIMGVLSGPSEEFENAVITSMIGRMKK